MTKKEQFLNLPWNREMTTAEIKTAYDLLCEIIPGKPAASAIPKGYRNKISGDLQDHLPDAEELIIEVDQDKSGNTIMGKVWFLSDGKILPLSLHQSAHCHMEIAEELKHHSPYFFAHIHGVPDFDKAYDSMKQEGA